MSRYTEDDSFFDDDSETDFLLRGAAAEGRDASGQSYPLQPTVPFIRPAPSPATAECPAFDSVVRVANSAAGPGLLAMPFIFHHAVVHSLLTSPGTGLGLGTLHFRELPRCVRAHMHFPLRSCRRDSR